jgi:hypothetical protein
MNYENTSQNDVVEIEEADVLGPSQVALIELGKDLIKDSINQSRDFHKTMLGLTATFSTLMASTFSIFVVGFANQQLNSLQRTFLVVPVILMLLSSVFFALGYYPRSTQIVLEDLTHVSQILENALKSRKAFALLGVVSFIFSIVSLLGGIAFLNVRH